MTEDHSLHTSSAKMYSLYYISWRQGGISHPNCAPSYSSWHFPSH